jgi:S1-C subfamily serine protease
MKKFSLFSVLFLLVALVGCASDPYRSVCQVRVGDGQGSGTLIAVDGERALVLTCEHVARKEGNSATLTWCSGEVTEGEVLYVVPGDTYQDDLAVILCESPAGIDPLPIAAFHPSDGPFTTVGYRFGEFYESVAETGTESDSIITFDQPYIGGMSGGPVLNKDGHVVGVGVGSNRKNVSVATDGATLAELSELLTE